MTITANLGFPRIGVSRELKWALEKAWRGGSYDELRSVAAALRARHWKLHTDRGIDRVPVGDFSLYDHMLDSALMVGAVPERFGGRSFDPSSGDDADLIRYFAMARGGSLDGQEVAPLEMTKWFDTNYHYLVPELSQDQEFQARPERLVNELKEALSLGVPARVVLVGPVTFLMLSKRSDGGVPLDLLDSLLPAYCEVVSSLVGAGVKYIQLDEPLLVGDLDGDLGEAYRRSVGEIRRAAPGAELTLATYFGPLDDNVDLALSLPVDVLHLDLVRGRSSLAAVLEKRPSGLGLSLGLVDGRNLWRSDLDGLLGTVDEVSSSMADDPVHLAPSCSLLHLPVSLEGEDSSDPELLSWLAFATERLDEISILGRALDQGADVVFQELAASRGAQESRNRSDRVHRVEVGERVAAVSDGMTHRDSPYPERRRIQDEALGLGALPTTTIGSFPQTPEVREVRRRFKRGEISRNDYEAALRSETEACVREQERLGLDVLVHGEFERTDMVEYFGEQLDGYLTTLNGWVQSYGSRCVKPPVIYGDIVRPAPMTVGWISYAASLTDRPMKGMLTGPVTMLEWSFVRDDQPDELTCMQLALALRDEVADLVEAGVRVIQVDEPALREGLPLRRSERQEYLGWATRAFRLATSAVGDDVQIHTHMCYGEFSDVIDAIVDMDADVISMEASRSRMELLGDFDGDSYPNEIGPGVWDIHSPRVPGPDELDDLVSLAVDAFGADRLWINPDCGLKTRGWPETRAALSAMVGAAERARARV